MDIYQPRHSAGLAVSLILAASSLPAFAQAEASVASESFEGLEEVVVTARKTAEQLLNVPLAVTAFTAEAIEARGITSLDDVAAFTPGLTFSNVLGEFLPAPVIRGVAPIDIFGELNTAIFLDGVYVAGREGINFSQLDLERIEVVKGPQAALYGRNAFSGAVNYVSRRPTDVFKGRATATLGNDGKLLGALTLSGPIGEGDLRGRVSLLHDEWEGSYDNAYAGPGRQVDIGGYTYKTLSGALYWQPSESFEAELGVYLSYDNIANSAASAVAANCEDRRIRDINLGVAAPRSSRLLNFCGEFPVIDKDALFAGPDAIGENRRVTRSNLKLTWDFANEATLTAITGYSKVTQDFALDGTRNTGTLTYTYQANPTFTVPFLPGRRLTRGTRQFASGLLQIGPEVRTEEVSQEFRFESDRQQRLRYAVGAYFYSNETTAGEQGVIATDALPADFFSFCLACTNVGVGITDFAPDAGNAALLPYFTDPLGGAIFGVTSIEKGSAPAVFGVLEYDVTDQMTASFEGRYTEEERQFKDNLTSASGKDSWDLLSWRGTLRYKPADNITFFGGVAQSEKSGDFDPTNVQLVSNPGVNVTLPGAFDSETLMSYELGVKAELFDRRLALEFDVYQLDWSDIVIPQVVSTINGQDIITPTGVNLNAGDASIKGAEFSLTARPVAGLDLNFGISYSDPKYDNAQVDSFVDFPSFAPDGDISGNQILRTSKLQANAGFQVTRTLRNDSEFFLRSDITHRGKQFADASNQAIVPKSTQVNASLGWRAEVWSVELWGRNLTDEDAPTGGFRDVFFTNTTPNGVNSGGTFFPFRWTVSHPRRTTYGLTLRYNF
jgi:iron complex outermembrane receptor protein